MPHPFPHPLRVLLLALATLPAAARTSVSRGDRASDFAGVTHWINSLPLTLPSLRGKVVLVDYWTIECINGLHALPQVKALDARYRGQELVVIGIHTPELTAEQVTGNLRAAMRRLGISHPLSQDNHCAIWIAWHKPHWPARYVIDAHDRKVYAHIDEGDYRHIELAVPAALAASR